MRDLSAANFSQKSSGFCPLASGSKGNAIYFAGEKTKILIDAGISAKQIQERLLSIGISFEEIDAILVTHEHLDHIQAIKVLTKKKPLPILCNAETAKGICRNLHIRPTFKIFTTNETFCLGDLEIHPFSIQHDTLDPVGLTIRMGKYKVGFCTDLGYATTLVKKNLESSDFLFLEANHQPSMVHASLRPLIYKQRVLGRQGHLSNEDCAALLASVAHPGLKHVFLAHLSSECNSPELAKKIIQKTLEKLSLSTTLSVAHQEKISERIFF